MNIKEFSGEITMTIGKKIKHIRNLYHMSSSELAEKTGIHPVSIRKYESDKMLPQQAQINRIAAAFMLSPAIFSGVTETKFDFNYAGDCLALLIMLYISNGLTIEGDRSENGALVFETVRFKISPAFDRFFSLYNEDSNLDINDLNLRISDENTLKSFMYWEYMYNRRDDYYEAYMDEETKENEAAYVQACDDYDEVEMRTLLLGRLGSIFGLF